MIAIIDYDAGNLKSVEKALAFLGHPCVPSRDKDEILRADGAILPGVGAFGDAMSQLEKYGLDRVVRELVSRRIPLLGICLGLQLLFDSSEECGGVPGLGLLPGRVVRFSQEHGLKIPHIGWNSLELHNGGRLFHGIPDGSYVYFVHSYYLKADDPGIVKAVTAYGDLFDASVEDGNIFACQFHPEKSGSVGLRILENFARICGSRSLE